MAQLEQPLVSYNLWSDPWILLELPQGGYERCGIEIALKEAHRFYAISAHSPLEVVGIHRLLTAILQNIFSPHTFDDLEEILQAGHFDPAAIDDFRDHFAGRFDLFSADRPFLQSGDLPLRPGKSTETKTVSYLFYELPSATNVVHFKHLYDDEQFICPACIARAMTIIPPFSTAGGKGFKTSINGVPPIYVIPGERNLFTSLVYSLILPEYQPGGTARQDLAWWSHPAEVGKSQEVVEVGYLHSLTFPARRIRLHPVEGNKACTRCGEASRWGVEKMIFEMGQFLPDDAPFWQDPFAGYVQKGDKEPIPIRPVSGKAAWREYSSLFLKKPNSLSVSKSGLAIRPAVLNQLDDFTYHMDREPSSLAVRCIGMRTDMKAKIFEWVDTGFDIPLSLLHSSRAGTDVDDALDFAGKSASSLLGVFSDLLNRFKKGSRYGHLKEGLRGQYWEALSGPFRAFILELAGAPNGEEGDTWGIHLAWYETVVRLGLKSFEATLEQIGDDGHSLRLRYQAINEARRRLYGQLKKEKEKHE